MMVFEENMIQRLQLSKAGCSCLKTNHHIDCTAYSHLKVFILQRSWNDILQYLSTNLQVGTQILPFQLNWQVLSNHSLYVHKKPVSTIQCKPIALMWRLIEKQNQICRGTLQVSKHLCHILIYWTNLKWPRICTAI